MLRYTHMHGPSCKIKKSFVSFTLICSCCRTSHTLSQQHEPLPGRHILQKRIVRRTAGRYECPEHLVHATRLQHIPSGVTTLFPLFFSSKDLNLRTMRHVLAVSTLGASREPLFNTQSQGEAIMSLKNLVCHSVCYYCYYLTRRNPLLLPITIRCMSPFVAAYPRIS